MKVAVVMGSKSDLPVMQDAINLLKDFGIDTVVDIVSAHRTPDKLVAFALPGMVASMSPLPVIGLPVKSSNSIDGWDSVLSILQMPAGVPVATVALNGAKNAGILAAQILAAQQPELLQRIIDYKNNLKQAVWEASKELNANE